MSMHILVYKCISECVGVPCGIQMLDARANATTVKTKNNKNTIKSYNINVLRENLLNSLSHTHTHTIE